MNAQVNGNTQPKDMSLDELFGDKPTNLNMTADKYFGDLLTNTRDRVKKILNIVVIPDKKGENKIYLKKYDGEVWGGFDEVGKTSIILDNGREVLWTRNGETEKYLDILTGEDVIGLFSQEGTTTIQ